MAAFDRSDWSLILKYLDTNGDGSGVNNAVGDYSSSPVDFFIQPPKDSVFGIGSLLISMEGDGLFRACDYGAIPALANGVTIQRTSKNGIVLKDLTDGVPIKCNGQWVSVAFDRNVTEDPPGTGNWQTICWKLGDKLPLILAHEERLAFTFNDDFTGLDSHRIRACGVDALYLHGTQAEFHQELWRQS